MKDIALLQKLEADTITEMPVRIPFKFTHTDNVPPGKQMKEYIIIRPISVRTWFRIRPLLLQIDKDDLNKLIVKDQPTEDMAEIMSKYDNLLLDIVCIGIHNKPTAPPQWFKEVLADNSTWKDILILLNAILYRIGFYPFCKSITTLKNVSPMDEAEIIAAQENLQSWLRQA